MKTDWQPLTVTELHAYLGILFSVCVSKGNHENISEMLKDGLLLRPCFNATMSRSRFEEITQCTRIDNLGIQ